MQRETYLLQLAMDLFFPKLRDRLQEKLQRVALAKTVLSNFPSSNGEDAPLKIKNSLLDFIYSSKKCLNVLLHVANVLRFMT